MYRNDWIDGPTAGDGIDYAVRSIPPAFSAAEGNFVDRVCRQYIPGIEKTLSPVGLWIIKVLIVRIGRISLRSPVAVVSAVVGAAPRESIRYLVLQTVREALL